MKRRITSHDARESLECLNGTVNREDWDEIALVLDSLEYAEGQLRVLSAELDKLQPTKR